MLLVVWGAPDGRSARGANGVLLPPVTGDAVDLRPVHAGHTPGRRSRGIVANRNSRREGAGMVLAASYNYPLLSIFWTILEIFLFVVWFWILITVFIDIFRNPTTSGWSKALWFLFVLLIPLIGVLVYLIVYGDSMHDRSVW
jgi:Phospholipase_D-nuclease N-terminal